MTRLHPKTAHDVFNASLEAAAASGVDIIPEFFSRFFAAHPEQRDSFCRPNSTQGAMVNEMILMLGGIAAGDAWTNEALETSVGMHQSYGEIGPDLYDSALTILRQTVATSAGTAWREDYDAVWHQLGSQLTQKIKTIHKGGNVSGRA